MFIQVGNRVINLCYISDALYIKSEDKTVVTFAIKTDSGNIFEGDSIIKALTNYNDIQIKNSVSLRNISKSLDSIANSLEKLPETMDTNNIRFELNKLISESGFAYDVNNEIKGNNNEKN